MEIIFILLAVIVIVSLIYVIGKRRNMEQNDITSEELSITNSNQLSISFSELPISAINNDTELVEIQDKRMLARINETMPELVRVAKNTSEVIQKAQNHGEVVYQAIIPAGEKLIKVRGKTDKYRGLIKGEKGIKDHVQLSKKTIDNGAQIAENAVSSAMNVASMVVGQYYMSEINAQLDIINDNITKISDFQDAEYKGKVIALITNVQTSSQFQFEIVENDEMRLQEIAKLNQYENTCAELLAQANVIIEKFSKKDTTDFASYEKDLIEIQKWYEYQQALLGILAQISELKYTYYLGQATMEYCSSVVCKCFEQSLKVSRCLNAWHDTNVNKYQIDISNNTRKRFGWDKIIHIVPSWIDEKYKLKALSENTVKRIEQQMSEPVKQNSFNIYSQDVKLISKDGKVFYLPSSKK